MPNTELEIEKINPSPSNMNKSLQLVGRDDFIVAEVHEMLASSFKTALLHISTKRIQAEEFEKNKADPTMQTFQIGYAMAHQCMYQHEVSRALWSRDSIHLFTCALTHTGLKTTKSYAQSTSLRTNFLTGLSYSISMIILFLKMMKLKKRSSGLMVQLHSSRTNICAT